MQRSVRRNALEKLAALSTKPSPRGYVDLTNLCKRCPSADTKVNGNANANGNLNGSVGTARVPMKTAELEVIIALCKAAPLVKSLDSAEQLAHQLGPYLSESSSQTIPSSPALRDIEPSPWESLTLHLTSALLSLGINHESLRPRMEECVRLYVGQWAQTASSLSGGPLDRDVASEDASSTELETIMTLNLSILGFLDAAAKYTRFWSAQERLQLVSDIRKALTEKFMVATEAAQSVVRTSRSQQKHLREWKRISKHYIANGRPLGSMLLHQGFMNLVVSSSALVVCPTDPEFSVPVLDYLQQYPQGHPSELDPAENALLEDLASIAIEEMEFVNSASDYLQQVGSPYQRQIASKVKADIFKTFVCCMVYNEEISDPDTLLAWLEATLSDPVQLVDHSLAATALKCLPIIAQASPATAANLSRILPRLIVQGGLDLPTAYVAADSLSRILKRLPEDAVITTLYSLGNVLSGTSLPDRNGAVSPPQSSQLKVTNTGDNTGSTISLLAQDTEEPSLVYAIVIQTVIGIAKSSNDEKIIALALSMLVQKIGKVTPAVDARILSESSVLGAYTGANELKSILKLYSKIAHDALINNDDVILHAVMSARIKLAREITIKSPLFEILIRSFLDSIISQGDAPGKDTKHHGNTEFAAQEIAQLLEPLATLVAVNADGQDHELDEEILTLQRDAWFNVAVHGFHPTSNLVKKYEKELRTLAQYSKPLISEERADQLESDIELNTILRRGKSSEHTDEQKKSLIRLLPQQESAIRSLSYSEVVFVNAVYLLEDLRASCGNCTAILTYFLDPKLRKDQIGECMVALSKRVVNTYLSQTLKGEFHAFSTPYLAYQLAQLFAGCCHRIAKVRSVATACADIIINAVPSTLCQKSALFALLEILSMMWSSCLEADTDEYEWRSTFSSPYGDVKVELGDDYSTRNSTLAEFRKHARTWVLKVIDIAPLDIKGLLQTYLSEYDDDGAYGHVSLGRSFALEMGSVVPTTDQRLGAIESHDLDINQASDFVAQYTTRQEYRFVDGLVDQYEEEWLREDKKGFHRIDKRPTVDRSIDDATKLLIDLEVRTTKNRHVPIAELRDILRRAAALLCRVQTDQCAIVQHLVGIPFAVFTKQSIKLGISLWTSVIKENPRMESRMLATIAENWESTIRKKRGIFNDKFTQPDPFFVKHDFAPTDKPALLRRQQQATNLIAPHFRLIQFLSSHFAASRLCSPYIERIYTRLIRVSVDAVGHGQTSSHPLAREVHLHIVLLALRILQYNTSVHDKQRWRLKDKILGAALAWFASPLKWSYGGNRLQMKAETHILGDIQAELKKSPADVGFKVTTSTRSLEDKQSLLLQLLSAEQTRLMVWLFPLNYKERHHFTDGNHHKLPIEGDLSKMVKVAWAENPALAVHLASRFQVPGIHQQVRWQILNFPEKVLEEPEALEILLGSSLPNDVIFQLKYLLYWKPINPITAVTYFMPAYGNHAFIIQYAMRTLESHPVDVTFFYVPQIVQTLRYDALGYVERYIVEAGQFSQLFAHQIIWNMKANSFKDEDSEIPDPVKPTLDKVMDRLVSSFTKEDRGFYEREFAFFSEVTSISGKLRPYIKRSKPEKKEKIEEELRKIQVDVGVYLPCNPEGVVIGIDRKSGKPLQSHAKAPYMATFRMRKDIVKDNDDDDVTGQDSGSQSVEMWKSAIFKVGDDCRQDLLALQMISAFRSIFNSVGLDAWVYPYRVTATAPGCGVIDVLPNSISRDMLGREAVNGLHDYFLAKYGGEESPRYQEARNNFVKSHAAYSVISYLLQFKDRHNGNLMIMDAGQIAHIDFGFCFDIAPGGIKFERAPFKLTTEMIAVLGGNNPPNQSYRWFEELCIKAFLACRPHAEHLIHLVICMLDSDLPCFKPETIKHLRERFVLEKSEMEAAGFMRDLIRKSAGSYTTKQYDHFQLLTNGIPY
ncbi:hypothetical protein EJ05DRAFT_339209 [Pseudovirgaria hyperparasitica]|uniref:1-phosphatidylinositol 4-kinase n=1 Tax=Pseudovirgaria hyperparasitica TaxID=470096 RepID=A0A6A6WBP2_9PEZI|nr:uncharacterized protein EJ05DRAFT_339209 [Pseudovirgaria hyperparasitica]KAF2759256.1 hypothetical protein EJ05DRAFT_339209 [Pseudovirgaria hyperparasitica]